LSFYVARVQVMEAFKEGMNMALDHPVTAIVVVAMPENLSW